MKQLLVLAGNSGKRLRPISTLKFPKFLHALDGGKKSLLQNSLDRFNYDKATIATNRSLENVILQQLSDYAISFSFEPHCKNTAVAIGLFLHQLDPNDILIVTPADHYISPTKDFSELVEYIAEFSLKNNIVSLIGRQASSVDSSLGMIYANANGDVVKFIEKPVSKMPRADNYTNLLKYYNLGIYIAKVQVFTDLYNLVNPKILHDIAKYKMQGDEYFFAKLPDISIDNLLPTNLPQSFRVFPWFGKWEDLGTWQSLRPFLS